MVFIINHCCPVKIHSVPNGTFNDSYLPLYQHLVPSGTVPAGLNVGRIKSNPLWLKSRRDEIYQALQDFLCDLTGQ
jgi:hypothetical protein